MKKKKGNFYDSYDKLFIKPKYKKKKVQKDIIFNEQTLFKNIGIYFSLIMIVIFLAWIGSSPTDIEIETDEKNAIVSESEEEVYDNYYPFKVTEVTQARNEHVDKANPLYVELDGNKLVTNKGYQIEFIEEVQIESYDQQSWSVIPTLMEYSSGEDIMSVSLYSVGRLVSSIYVEIYENVINGKYFFMDTAKGSFTKVYPEETTENVQTGYMFKHDGEDESYLYDDIYRYYIFNDGTGILLRMNGPDKSKNENVSDDMTYEEFRNVFKDDLEFLERKIVLSPI
ncbi:hypothetical protein JNUCC83_08255 [Vagococcus sp. JNUCC 83]